MQPLFFICGSEIKAIGNLYFAGEHCSKDYQGFMNGAAETGRMASGKIRNAIKSGASIEFFGLIGLKAGRASFTMLCCFNLSQVKRSTLSCHLS